MPNRSSRWFLAQLALASIVLAGCAATPDESIGTSESEVVVCAKGPTVEGIDVSSWQGSINWSAVKASGKQFAFIRVSDGTYLDKYFNANWSGAKAAGLLRGTYQFWHPGTSVDVQANIVISAVGKLGVGDLPVVCDVEATDGQPAGVIAANLKAWLDKVEAGTGKRPIIYSGKYFWNDNVRSNAFTGYPLWIPAYGPTCPNLPDPWGNWSFFQYSDSGSVGGISGGVDVDKFNGSLADLNAMAGAAASCDRSAGGFTFSCDGPNDGLDCINVNEPGDPDTWNDNYFCSDKPVGMKWSYAGPIAGMDCTLVSEGAEKGGVWDDNYICLPPQSPIRFKWSSAGPIAGMSCVQWNETVDPDTWNDNYLCSAPVADFSAGGFTFSSDGPNDGQFCTKVDEPGDPDSWADNHFCSNEDIGMKWSYAGPIEGMDCTNINEGAEPEKVWGDNFLCLPPGSKYKFTWSSAGPIEGKTCVRWYEALDKDESWSDNYLCVETVPEAVPPVSTPGGETNGNPTTPSGKSKDNAVDTASESSGSCSAAPTSRSAPAGVFVGLGLGLVAALTRRRRLSN